MLSMKIYSNSESQLVFNFEFTPAYQKYSNYSRFEACREESDSLLKHNTAQRKFLTDKPDMQLRLSYLWNWVAVNFPHVDEMRPSLCCERCG